MPDAEAPIEEADADPVPVPDSGTDARDAAPDISQRKRVFVSSHTHNGSVGGYAGADEICQAGADAAKLGGTFRALLSAAAGQGGPDLKEVGPWYLVDRKTVVVQKLTALSSIENPIEMIEMTENGDLVAPSTQVWTGARLHCESWRTTNPYMLGTVGLATSVDKFAVSDDVGCLTTAASFYCFEQ